MPDPRKKLYSALSSKYDLGSYDEFNSKMNNPESRKKLFDSASKNFDLGSYNEFENKVKKKKKFYNLLLKKIHWIQSRNLRLHLFRWIQKKLKLLWSRMV